MGESLQNDYCGAKDFLRPKDHWDLNPSKMRLGLSTLFGGADLVSHLFW